MDKTLASVTLSYDKTSSGLYSIKLRVTHNRLQRRYAFPFKEPVLVSPIDFDRLVQYHQTKSRRAAEEVKTLYAELEPSIQKAIALTQTLHPFSFETFRQAFYGGDLIDNPKTDVLALLRAKARQLDADGFISNADNYTSSAASFERFVADLSDEDYLALFQTPRQAGTPLLLKHITPGFLSRYERWMLQYGKAPRSPKGQPSPAGITTISIYCRNLRAIFNEAMNAKPPLIGADVYPFGKGGFVIPASVNTKKALSKADVLRIIQYQTEPGSTEQRSKDFWVFSYLCNGMNMADIFRLRWKDLDLTHNTLTFIRQKTTTTRKAKQMKVVATLFAESLAILERWGNPSRQVSDYVFPFLDETMNPRRQKAVIRQLLKQTNKYMGRVAEVLGITEEVNTYAARHSFATILLRSEAPVAFISQSLGHTSLKTTEDYLGSFEDEQTKNYLKNLL